MTARSPGRLVAVDPSVSATGVAVFLGGLLHRAYLVQAPSCSPKGVEAWLWMAVEVTATSISAGCEVAVEVPQVYQRGVGDQNDLITLAGVAGAIVGRCAGCRITSYLPAQWKGQVPKPKRASDPYIIEERVRARLSPEEARRVELPSARSLQHNVWDACGIGLRHLGR